MVYLQVLDQSLLEEKFAVTLTALLFFVEYNICVRMPPDQVLEHA